MATRLKGMRLSELSLVDRPANGLAKVSIFKRDVSDEERQRLADSGAAMPDGGFPIKTKADLQNAIRAIGRASNPAAAKKHIIARAKALGATDLLPDGWVSKSAGDGNPDHEGERIMDPTELQKKIDDAVKTATADLTKRAETAEAIAKMTDAEKAHYEKLADGDKPAFLAKSTDARKADIAKAQSTDEVVYKSADGTEFRKSDDPRMIAMAKRADESDKIAKAEREARETAEFAKRAETEMPHLPGEAAAKAAVLKHMAGAGEDVRKTFDALVKAGDAAIKGAFQTVGFGKGAPEPDSARGKLDAAIKKHAEDNKVSIEQATVAVVKTAEGAQLDREARLEKRAAA